MDDGSFYAAYLRRMGVLYFGILLVLLAAFFGALHLKFARKNAYVKSHPSVTAIITSKKETRGKGPYTQVTIDYWHETFHGLAHCAASLNLAGWSREYDVGKTVDVFPREDACYEPYRVLPGDDSNILLACSLSLALISVVMIGVGGFLMRRSRTSAIEP